MRIFLLLMIYLMNWLRFSRLEGVAVPPSQVTQQFSGLKKWDIVKFVLCESCCWFKYSLFHMGESVAGWACQVHGSHQCMQTEFMG
jgi:hypothetical protein